MTSHNNQKKIAVINDYSGFGRCSMAVALPVISVMKVQCCPIPTSVFSNHTGFDSYFCKDFTNDMDDYIREWKKLELTFDAINTGFLGSEKQIDIVLRFVDDFENPDTMIIVDPVMGDYGKKYLTYTDVMCEKMRKLIKHGDIITPNITEACILTDTEYKEYWDIYEVEQMARHIADMSSKKHTKVCITGVPQGRFLSNICYEDGNEKEIKVKKVGGYRSGTGDIFSAIIAADAVNGVPFELSVKKAAAFITEAVIKTQEKDVPESDGLCFEEVLYKLGDSKIDWK